MTADSYMPPHPRRRGQVLLITLLAITLLAGLVCYVYNVGSQVNQRMALQHAADSAAVSGVDWLARSMNVTAMNNVAISKLLATILVLDSVPKATQISYDEVSDLEQGLASKIQSLDAYVQAAASTQPSGGSSSSSDTAALQTFETAMKNLDARMKAQKIILEGVDQALNRSTFRMEEFTHWLVDGSSLPGKLWQAALALDNISRATMSSAGVLAQQNAVQWAKTTTPAGQVGFLVPTLPRIPYSLGPFSYFQPTLQGQVNVTSTSWTARGTNGSGGAIPDTYPQRTDTSSAEASDCSPYRLGPWARLLVVPDASKADSLLRRLPGESASNRGHGYRRAMHVGSGGGTGGGASQGAPSLGGTGSSLFSSLSGSSYGTVTGYTTYGPYQWELSQVYNYWRTSLPDTLFNRYCRTISDAKLRYMFTSKTAQMVHCPLWVTDYAKAVADSQTDIRILSTKYYTLEVRTCNGATTSNSSSPRDQTFPRWTPPDGRRRSIRGDYEQMVNRLLGNVRPSSGSGTHDVIWTDSAGQQLCEMKFTPLVDNLVWKVELVTASGLGRDTQPTPVTYTYYFTFGGIDVGGDQEVSDPCEGADSDSLPRPTLLAQFPNGPDDVAAADQGWRRSTFTFLGVASIADKPPLWQKRFYSYNPAKRMVALAQVELFNNSSWDLWTQDWRAQLVPVSQWSDWFGSDSDRQSYLWSNLPDTDGALGQADVDAAHEYLSRITPALANQYMSH